MPSLRSVVRQAGIAKTLFHYAWFGRAKMGLFLKGHTVSRTRVLRVPLPPYYVIRFERTETLIWK